MKPDSTISAIRPSMIALVSTTMWGSPAAWPRSARRGPADEPDRLGGEEQVLALRDGQARACRARGRARRPSGSHVPSGSLERATAAGPSRRPISRPSSSPTTAVTNSAVESCWTWRIQPARPGRPSGTAGSRTRRPSRRRPRRSGRRRRSASPGRRRSVERSRPAGRRGRARRARRARSPSRRMLRITVSSRRTSGRRTGRRVGRAERGRQPSIAPGPPPRVRRPRPSAASTASRSDVDRDRRRCPRRARDRSGRRARRAGTIARREPQPGRLAQPPLEPGDRAQLAEQADLADRDGAGRDRPVAERGREGEGDRQVEAGLARPTGRRRG